MYLQHQPCHCLSSHLVLCCQYCGYKFVTLCCLSSKSVAFQFYFTITLAHVNNLFTVVFCEQLRKKQRCKTCNFPLNLLLKFGYWTVHLCVTEAVEKQLKKSSWKKAVEKLCKIVCAVNMYQGYTCQVIAGQVTSRTENLLLQQVFTGAMSYLVTDEAWSFWVCYIAL